MALICVSAVSFLAIIAAMMYLCGYIDGRVYASIYDSGSFKPAKVDDVEKTTVVEGEMS